MGVYEGEVGLKVGAFVDEVGEDDGMHDGTNVGDSDGFEGNNVGAFVGL